MPVYYYSVIIVLGFCLILFLALMIQKKKEETKRRIEMEFITAQRRLEESREKLNNLRKLLYEIENQLNTNNHYYNTKKEELIQVVKHKQDAENDKDGIQQIIDQATVSEQEMNILNNRMRLNREKFAELNGKAQQLQQEVDTLGESSAKNENEIAKLQHQIAQAESELQYNKELAKLKEKLIKT